MMTSPSDLEHSGYTKGQSPAIMDLYSVLTRTGGDPRRDSHARAVDSHACVATWPHPRASRHLAVRDSPVLIVKP